MADYTLEAQARTVTGKKVGQIRTQGLVPATVYGPRMQPVSIQIPYRPLELTLRGAGGTNLIEIKIDGEAHIVLVREVKRDVIKRTIEHVDFFALDLTSKIRTVVPVQFFGESAAVQRKLGVLITGANSLTVEMLPAHMMHSIDIDLEKLATVGSAIHVSDLDLGENVVIINDPEELIARISQTSAARSEEDEGGEFAAEPEVIAKGKEDDADF